MPDSGIGPLDQLNKLTDIVGKAVEVFDKFDQKVLSTTKNMGSFGSTAGKAGGAMSGIVPGGGMIPMDQSGKWADGGGAAGGGGGRVMGGSSNFSQSGGQSNYVPPYANGAGGGGGDSGGGGFGGGPQSFGGATGTGLLSNLMNLMLIGPQYMFNRVEGNRALAASLSSDVRSMSLYSGRPSNDILEAFGNKMPMMGNPNQMAAAGNIAGSFGYGDLLRPQFGSGRFMEGARQMQLMTPGVGADQIVKERGEFLGNIPGQQRALMLTGGAMSGFTSGGQPKTLVEWAEGVLKWFESIRPGKDRGKAFSSDEISTQMFPGSNMRAWFDSMNTPSYMVDAFWKYAINMRSGTKSSFEEVFSKGDMGADLALKRLGTATSGSEREFKFMSAGGPGSSWYEQYVKREQADTGFNKVLLNIVDKLLGPTSGSFMSDMVAGTPTPIANMLANMAFTTIPHMLSDTVSSIPLIGGLLGDPVGDVGDVGDYGDYGATSTTGMDPSFGKRVRQMMRANPRLRINSGFREGTTQSRLAAKGVGRVTPSLDKSMHTKGLAADMGPRSEYGWIAQNAGKFGLDQASRHGEPWHVGPPGTIGDPGKSCCPGCGGLGSGIGDPALSSLRGGLGIGDAAQSKSMESTPCGQAMMQIWPRELWPWALQVIYDESRGDPSQVNSIGATGCFQMRMPMHADLFNGADPLDPRANAAAALKLFAGSGPGPWKSSNHGSRDALLPANYHDIAVGKASTVDPNSGSSGGIISDAIDFGKQVFGGAIDAAGSAISTGADFLKSLAGGPFDVFKNLVVDFAKGDFKGMFDFNPVHKIVQMVNSMTSGMGFSPGGGALQTSAGFANMLADRIGQGGDFSGIFNGGGGFWDGGDPVGDPVVSMGARSTGSSMSSYASKGGVGGSISVNGGGQIVMTNHFNISGGSVQDASRTAQVVASHINSLIDDRNRRAS